jgi:hypothetical protein
MVRYEDDLQEALENLFRGLPENSGGEQNTMAMMATDFASAAAGFSVSMSQEGGKGEGVVGDGAQLLYKLLNLLSVSGVSFDQLAAELIAMQREAGQEDNPLRARNGNPPDTEAVKLPPKLR